MNNWGCLKNLFKKKRRSTNSCLIFNGSIGSKSFTHLYVFMGVFRLTLDIIPGSLGPVLWHSQKFWNYLEFLIQEEQHHKCIRSQFNLWQQTEKMTAEEKSKETSKPLRQRLKQKVFWSCLEEITFHTQWWRADDVGMSPKSWFRRVQKQLRGLRC